MRICSNINCLNQNPQTLQSFYKNASNKPTLCKRCIKENRKNYYQINKTKQKEQTKKYDLNHIDNIKGRQKKYYNSNNGKQKRCKYYKHYFKNQYKNNVQFKLSVLLRSRLREAIKNNQKVGSAVNDLGCSIYELKQHLESKFQEGMTWNNHGVHGWHIDHIIPLSLFDLENREQFLKACHYTNLQPLWSTDNLTKLNNI